MRFLLVLFVALSSFSISAVSSETKLSDFEILEGSRTILWYKVRKKDVQELDFYKKIYLKNCLLLQEDGSKQDKIPKVLHFIWIGPHSFPQESIKYVESWKKYHPEWTMKFWTDSAERDCPIKGMERHLIDEVDLTFCKDLIDKTDNYAEKSDLLRYEILYHEGGTYVDHDVECYHSFDQLHGTYDFYAGLEPPHRNAKLPAKFFPSNALFGSKAQHPVLKSTMEFVKKNWSAVEEFYPANDAKSNFSRVITRSFNSFTLGTKEGIDQKGNVDIIFPASFFSPDRIIPENTMEIFKEKGFVLASHKYAATWLDPVPEDPLKELLESYKQHKASINKKISSLTLFMEINCLITLILIILYLRHYRIEKREKSE